MTERHVDGGIAGWTFKAQLDWLGQQAKSRYRIAEIGAWKGRCTHALASATPGKVWVVDNWNSTDPKDEATTKLKAQGRDTVFSEFLVNLQPWSRKLVIMQMNSEEAWRRLSHLTFDMIWIDGDHRYEYVKRDISMWRSLLAPGGLLCGHDGEIDSVARALRELVPDAKFHATPQPPPFEHRDSLIWWKAPTTWFSHGRS